ncbi:MAG: prepilin-type N-terminal cleavage/methylation domain-containing protein [Gemmatimonadaceae bacterium]
MRNRRGFTLIEVVVTAVILVLIAAVTVPIVAGSLREADARETARILAELSRAVTYQAPQGDGRQGFYQRITVYPMLVSHLTSGIATTERNSCGALYAAGNVTSWNTAATGGPFFPFQATRAGADASNPSGGVVTPLGTVIDTIVRGNCALVGGTATNGQPMPLSRAAACTGAVTLVMAGSGAGTFDNYLGFLIRGVPLSDAQLLDRIVDGVTPPLAANGDVAGTLRYFSPSEWPPNGATNGTGFADVLYLVATAVGRGSC